MARLNEPPAAPAPANTTAAPTESVDARKYLQMNDLPPTPITTAAMRTKSKLILQRPPADLEEVKRRFIRQNRELAKNNSSQSLRIRNLELEVSRLLSDNLDLRNEVLHLQNEVFTAQRQASNAAARRVKEQLQAKLAELSGIVDGIDEQESPDHGVREKKPLEGNWRERQPLTELMRDSQMPTIVEDKQYPRRTMGAEEFQAIRLSDHSSNESPDLGPPPVARFDYEDPVKNASPLGNKTSPKPAATGEEDVLPATLSVNLETRRKRKDGSSRLEEIRRHSLGSEAPATMEGETPSTMLRTGAKRKLADRESEKPIKPPSKGDFTFSRKTTTTAEEARPVQEKAASKEISAPASPPKPARKALSDKSVNMSPRKTVPNQDNPEKDIPKKPTAPKPTNNKKEKDAAPNRRRRVSSIPQPSPPREVLPTVEIAPPPEETHDPKTPAALDLFSPTPSEPSAKPEAGRGDTPPPSDLSTLSMSTTDGGARPARRARGAAVNYAEPSLISKMRRPDKKMVDAIEGIRDPRRSTAKEERMVEVKREPGEEDEEDQEWRNLPAAVASPLHQKGGEGEEIPVTMPPDPTPSSKDLSTTDDRPSASSATISALMAGSRKRRLSSAQQQQPLGTDMDLDKKMQELDLYDFKESSSPPPPGEGSKASRQPASNKTAHRRHSSVPKEVTAAAAARAKDDSGLAEQQKKGGGGEGRSERAASRRRSMML